MGGKERGREVLGRDLPDQCQTASYAPVLPSTHLPRLQSEIRTSKPER